MIRFGPVRARCSVLILQTSLGLGLSSAATAFGQQLWIQLEKPFKNNGQRVTRLMPGDLLTTSQMHALRTLLLMSSRPDLGDTLTFASTPALAHSLLTSNICHCNFCWDILPSKSPSSFLSEELRRSRAKHVHKISG